MVLVPIRVKEDRMSVLQEVPIGDVKLADDNVRQDVGDVSELAASVKAGGVLQPLLVNEADNVVVAGARRLAAAKAAGLKVVPVVKRAFTEQERLETMLVENLQREDLSPLEEAAGYQRLVEMGLSQRQIATRVGRSQATVAKRLSLLVLPEKVQQEVEKGGISLPDAQELAKLKDEPKLVEKIAKADGRGYGQSISSKVSNELEKRGRENERLAAVEALKKKGETVVDVTTDEWGHRVTLPEGMKEVRAEAFTAEFVEMPPKKHAKLECHAVYVHPRTFEPVEVCTQPGTHPSKADQIKAERKKQQERDRKAKQAFKEMTDRRRDFVKAQIKARTDKDALLELLWEALRHDGGYGYYGQTADEYELAYELLGLEKPGPDVANPDEIEWDVLLDAEAAKSVAARVRVTFAFAAAKFESQLERDGSWRPERPWFEWLVKRGYELSPHEKELTNGD